MRFRVSQPREDEWQATWRIHNLPCSKSRLAFRMQVSKTQIIKRGITQRCPNCGERTLFPPGSFRINERCPACETALNRGEGFFLGPFVVNYTIAVVFFVVPALVAAIRGVISWKVAGFIAIFGCSVIPGLLYRSSWSWWLMLYFYALPERLPANGGPKFEGVED